MAVIPGGPAGPISLTSGTGLGADFSPWAVTQSVHGGAMKPQHRLGTDTHTWVPEGSACRGQWGLCFYLSGLCISFLTDSDLYPFPVITVKLPLVL